MKNVVIKSVKPLRHISAKENIMEAINKTVSEKVKFTVDFYSYFNENDRKVLKIIDSFVVNDTGILVTEIHPYDERFVSFVVSEGVHKVQYRIDVIVVMSDGQEWVSQLLLYVDNNIDNAFLPLPLNT